MELDYIDFLCEEIARRKSRNDRYSERAFARSIGLSAGFLKHLLQRKKGLGRERALDVARRLNWSDLKADRFIEALDKRKLGSKVRQNGALLKHDIFKEISDWYAFPSIELNEVRPIKNAADCAKRLGISKVEADHVLRRLEHAGLIRMTPTGYQKAKGEYEMPSLSSGAIRKFHRQSLLRAVDSVDSQAFGTRELRALTLAFDTDRLGEAQVEIAKFIKRFERRFANGKKNAVYQMNMAFYRIDRS